MPDFDNPKDLFKYIESQIKDVQENEMAEMVKDEMQSSIKSMVYDAYQPKSKRSAERRGYDGGLIDKRNMIHTVTNTINGMELFIKNITQGNPNVDYTDGTYPNNYLTGIIVYGRTGANKGLYLNDRHEQYTKPRDFISDAMLRIQKQLKHVKIMKNALKNKGIDVD